MASKHELLMSNFGIPGNPSAPAGWVIPGNVPLTEESVRQFEKYFQIDWTQLTNLPGNVNGNEARMVTLEKKAGNIFSPLNYGAVGDGVTNDGPAIRACLVAARAWANAGTESASHRLPVVDFGGLRYATAIQIEVPGGQGLTIQNGLISPAVGFTAGMYLMRVGDSADPVMIDGFRNVNTTFRNFYFDNRGIVAGRVGGGLLLERFMRCLVERCLFAHYTTVGLKTTNTGSHELICTNCQFGEYWWGETDGVNYLNSDLYSGTGIDCDSNDNMFSNIVIQLSKIGCKVNRSANQFQMLHIWTGYVKDPATVAGPTAALTYLSTGLWITQNATGCQFNQMYMDGCEVLWENPWKTTFTNSFFLNGWGDANRGMIRFKPMAAGQFADGVVITGNYFQIVNSGVMKMISIDTSVGTFNSGQVTNCYIRENTFTGAVPKYTHAKKALSQSAASTWTLDFTGVFAFGDGIQHVLWSVYHWGGGAQFFRMTNITNAVVTISSFSTTSPFTALSANNATVYVEASISKFV